MKLKRFDWKGFHKAWWKECINNTLGFIIFIFYPLWLYLALKNSKNYTSIEPMAKDDTNDYPFDGAYWHEEI